MVLQCVVAHEFVRDGSFDEGAVGRLDDLVIGAEPLGLGANLVEDIRDPRFVAHLVAVRFDAGGFFDVVQADGQQRHDLAVEGVDLGAHLGHVGAGLTPSHIRPVWHR